VTRGPIPRAQWDKEKLACLERMMRKHPDWPLRVRNRRCIAITEAHWGPRPPSLAWALLKAAIGYARSGGDMPEFNKGVNLKKAVKAALFGAVIVFLASFDTPEEWIEAGIPEWAAPVAAIVVGGFIKSFTNYLKIAKRINLP
jgi:hypothetical protein